MQRDPSSVPGGVNADYLAIAEGAITKFQSAKQWLVGGYSPLNIYPQLNPTMYDTLWDRYTKRCGPVSVDASDRDHVRTAVDSGCSILKHNSPNLIIDNASWSAGPGYNGEAAVVFVEGYMEIDRNIKVSADTGIIFIVRGDIKVYYDPGAPPPTRRVTQIDGVYIADGKFNSNAIASCDDLQQSGKLTVNGAVYAFDEACFTRDLQDNDYRAEQINFEPKYLWLFREIIGETKTVFRELAP